MRVVVLLLVLAFPPLAVAQPHPVQQEPEPPTGFVSRGEEPGRPEPVELGAETVTRYEGALVALVAALENEEVEAYENLMSDRLLQKHRKANDPLSGLLDFMAAVMAKRGGFARFHELGNGARSIPDSEYPMLPAVFHLEDGTSGYIGLALDAQDKIDHLSLFVKEDICPLGAACDVPAHVFVREDH